MASEVDMKVKIITTGTAGSGKTSLIQQYLKCEFRDEYKPTKDIEKTNTTLMNNGITIQMEMIDNQGNESFRVILKAYHRDADGLLIFCDLTDRESFDKLQQFVDNGKEYAPKDCVIILVGSKCDMESERVTSFDEMVNMAAALGLEYVEISSKTGKNIPNLFDKLFNKIAIQKMGVEGMERASKSNY